jgi:hypothetical protein
LGRGGGWRGLRATATASVSGRALCERAFAGIRRTLRVTEWKGRERERPRTRSGDLAVFHRVTAHHPGLLYWQGLPTLCILYLESRKTTVTELCGSPGAPVPSSVGHTRRNNLDDSAGRTAKRWSGRRMCTKDSDCVLLEDHIPSRSERRGSECENERC